MIAKKKNKFRYCGIVIDQWCWENEDKAQLGMMLYSKNLKAMMLEPYAESKFLKGLKNVNGNEKL